MGLEILQCESKTFFGGFCPCDFDPPAPPAPATSHSSTFGAGQLSLCRWGSELETWVDEVACSKHLVTWNLAYKNGSSCLNSLYFIFVVILFLRIHSLGDKLSC